MAELLPLSRTLDLSIADDRAALAHACGLDAELRSLVEDCVGDYLRWFRAPEWRTVYSGGLVAGPRARRPHASSGHTIGRLLEATRRLQQLETYDGFPDLVRGLANPTQVDATLFEIAAASWCSTRAVHEGLGFSPEVRKASGVKRPDFVWHTGVGTLYCECKVANTLQRRESQRLQRLMEIASAAQDSEGPWPGDLRLDIVIDGTLGRDPAGRLAGLVRSIAADVRRGERPTVADGSFSLTLRLRDEPPPDRHDSLSISRVQVGQRATPLGPESASLTLVRPLSSLRASAATALVKEAKKQLPVDAPGAVFVDVSSGGERAIARLREMLAHPAHRGVVWVCVWTAGVAHGAVWQTEQRFNRRLLEARSAPASAS